ncbi:MAG: type II secretion system F family protein [Candidatus Omnitrophica bacterium]|nr:type II secretion system F family protein [Candidatus Omnitrophota bacterium]MBU1872090.1 type II secretion system F family protein [Candidatus Omnitrophota bacterium]
MPTYIYKAVDSKGKTVKGELDAVSEIDVSTQLAKIGYLPVSISFKQEKVDSFIDKLFKKGKNVNIQSLVIFTREFATIIKAAVPMLEGLMVLAEQTEDIALKEALNQVVHDIEGGSSLSGAMSKHPGVFSDLYVNTVVAGESAGVLEKVLFRLSRMLEDDQETRTNIKAAMRYPIMVVFALFTAVFVLSVFVIPNFAQMYTDMKVGLPLPTQIMIWISHGFKQYWFITFPSIFGAAFLFKWFINTKEGRFLWDGFKFKMAVVGKVYSKITMLRFTSMLSVLYQAGLPVLKTMDIVGLTIGNVVLAKEIEILKRDVADGKGISGAVLNSKYFPRLVGYMISVGEKSGALPAMLDSLCEYFTLEVKTTVRNLTTLIEPIMTAILGIAVMGMALSIFMPMWGMLKVIRGG